MYAPDALSLVVDDAALRLSPRELNERIETQLAGLSDLERESFDDVLRTVGQGAQTALPGVVQGASMGAAAGPWGALIGGLAGGALSLATSSGTQGRAPSPPPRAPAPASRPTYTPPTPPPVMMQPPMPQQPMTPAAAAPTPVTAGLVEAPAPFTTPPASSSPNPAAQLLWVMQNPRVLQAVASLVAGPMGRQQLPVGQSSAPPAAFLNLLNVLASQAGDRAESYAESTSDEYLRDAEGEYAWDVVNPEARARALMTHLRQEARSTPTSIDAAGAWLLESGLVELDASGVY